MSQTQVERLFIKDRTSLMTDTFRLTTSLQTSDADITANLERADDALYGKLGLNMTESSGVFTFPSTGIYKLTFIITGYRSGESRYNGAQIYTTANDGTSWDTIALCYEASTGISNNYNFTMTTTGFFDCTNTSTHKAKFYVNAYASTYFRGDTDRNNTCMIFERMGDT
jgi:hypothetical protein|tara:strand:- start:113 stop:619 length:507 start_codon:yes stop_codon:yes gene_type:complete